MLVIELVRADRQLVGINAIAGDKLLCSFRVRPPRYSCLFLQVNGVPEAIFDGEILYLPLVFTDR